MDHDYHVQCWYAWQDGFWSFNTDPCPYREDREPVLRAAWIRGWEDMRSGKFF